MDGAQTRGSYAVARPASSGGVKVGDSRPLNTAVAPFSTSTRNFHTCQFLLPSSLSLSRPPSPGSEMDGTTAGPPSQIQLPASSDADKLSMSSQGPGLVDPQAPSFTPTSTPKVTPAFTPKATPTFTANVTPTCTPTATWAHGTASTSGGLDGYGYGYELPPFDKYLLWRPNGRYTRLIPADMLPPLRDIPPQQIEKAGSYVLMPPNIPSANGTWLYNEPVSLLAQSAPRPVRALGTKEDLQNRIDTIIASAPIPIPIPTPTPTPNTNTPSSNETLSSPTTPGGTTATATRPRRAKVYCDKWVHEGTCAFAQQGCKYKHEMPHDKATQHMLGLFHGLPTWWKRQQAELARQAGREREREREREKAQVLAGLSRLEVGAEMGTGTGMENGAGGGGDVQRPGGDAAGRGGFGVSVGVDQGPVGSVSSSLLPSSPSVTPGLGMGLGMGMSRSRAVGQGTSGGGVWGGGTNWGRGITSSGIASNNWREGSRALGTAAHLSSPFGPIGPPPPPSRTMQSAGNTYSGSRIGAFNMLRAVKEEKEDDT